jgi:hypothetical protein
VYSQAHLIAVILDQAGLEEPYLAREGGKTGPTPGAPGVGLRWGVKIHALAKNARRRL